MAKDQSTLKFLSSKSKEMGRTHNVWTSAGYDSISIKKANVEIRLLTGVYTLQSNICKFNKSEISDICQMCWKDVENKEHFLLYCTSTEKKTDIRFCHHYVQLYKV